MLLRRSATLQGPAGILVDAGGSPVGSALRLEGLGGTPRALAASGPFLLLVSEAGIHVFERQHGGEVQRLAFSQDLRPLPGQPLYAAVAGDGLPQPAAAATASGSGAAGCVAVAGRRIVWLCLPVSPADQARQLLGSRDFEAALQQIEAGLAQGAPWAQAGAAQAALLLLQGARALAGSPGLTSQAGLHTLLAVIHIVGRAVPCLCKAHMRPHSEAFPASIRLPAWSSALQRVGSRRQCAAWNSAAPPPSSPASFSRSSPPTLHPGHSRRVTGSGHQLHASCLEEARRLAFRCFCAAGTQCLLSASAAAQVPTHEQYWGLHASLASLEALISRKLSSEHRQSDSGSSGAQSPSPGRGARSDGAAGRARGGGSSASSGSPFAVDRGGAGREEGLFPDASPARSNQLLASKSQHPGNQQEGAGQPPASPEALAQQAQREQRRETAPGGAERRRLQRQACEALAHYLFRVRRGEHGGWRAAVRGRTGSHDGTASRSSLRGGRPSCLPASVDLCLPPLMPLLASAPSPVVPAPCRPCALPLPPQARMLQGVTCLPGVDTLLLLLLADLGDARQVAAFAAVPNQVDVPSVEARLQVGSGQRSKVGGRPAQPNGRGPAPAVPGCLHEWPPASAPSPLGVQAEGWQHALATLYAARPGGAQVALRIWRQVADGQLAAPASPRVQAAERREALESAAALLRDPAACPQAVLLPYIPWLLAASQPAALQVLTARSLTPAAVLPLLPTESDVRWQYLAHLVEAAEQPVAAGAAGGKAGAPTGAAEVAAAAADPAIHTELATQLAAAILRAEPGLQSPASRPSSGGGGAAHRSSAPNRRPSSAGGAGRCRLHRASTAALVSGGSLELWPGATPAEAMRLRLRAHLQRSGRYDAGTVLRSLQGTGLHEELVVLYSKARRASEKGRWASDTAGRASSLASGPWLDGPCTPSRAPVSSVQHGTCRHSRPPRTLPPCPTMLSAAACAPPCRWATTWRHCAHWR